MDQIGIRRIIDDKNGWLRSMVFRGILLIVAVFLLFLASSHNVYAENKVVKVGAIVDNSFIEADKGVYRGYGVEYLEEIARYTGWSYVYVFDTWENLERRLDIGEVDMLCTVQYTSERADKYLFSNIPLGYEYSMIYTMPESDIYYEDYDAMKGKKVGLMGHSMLSDAYVEFEEAKDLDNKLIYYDAEEKAVEALIRGEVDIAVTGNLYSRNDLKAIGRLGTSPFYCVMDNRNMILMEELNDALQNIKVENPGIEASLAEKYYGDNQVSGSPLFTREEYEYIKKAEAVKIKLVAGKQPISYMSESGEKGIIVDYLELLSKNSGLRFDIDMSMDPMTIEEQTKQMLDDDYLMVRSKRALENAGLDQRLIMSNSLYTTQLSYVIARSEIGRELRNDFSFAITSEMGYFEDLLDNGIDQYKVQYYNNTEECFDAVMRGDADIAVQDGYLVTHLLQKPIYATNLTESVGKECLNSMCIVAAEDKQILINILNKTINFIKDEERDRIVEAQLLMNPYELKFTDVLYRYWKVLLLVAIVLIGSATVYVIMMRRITKLQFQKKEYELLSRKVQLDELTGVYNRPFFYKKARRLIDDTQEDMCVALMDISNFKVINDLYGMHAGDQLLCCMAMELKQRCEGRNIVIGRFNSDHFYMCMKKTDFEEIQFPKRYKTFLDNMDVTVIYGVYLISKKDVPINIMCDRASLAAHDEDRKKSEYIRYYSEDERNKLIREQEIVNEMEKALEGHQFHVFIQPKYNIFENKIVGGEALVRWFHPEKGIISPAEFVPIFEKNGFIIPLDYYVWDETCRFIAELRKKGYPSLPISINVSRAHFYGKELKDKLEELIKKYGLSLADLELEITETICAEDPDIIYKRVRELQKDGFKVAMDDFGSGYSSLNMLKEMPLDIIKMDMKFLDGGEDEAKSRTILGTLIKLAKSMNLYVVVEGVETEDQVNFLRSIGSRCAQGYYYSKPVDCNTYEAMLAKEKDK